MYKVTAQQAFDEAQKMAQLREQGLSYTTIAEELGTTRYRVWAILGPATGKWAPAPTLTEVTTMMALRQEGKTNMQIAEALGTTRHRVGSILGPSDRPRRPRVSDVKPRRVVVRLTDNDYEALEQAASDLGILPSNAPNRPTQITVLLESIAAGDLRLVPVRS